MSTPSDTPDKEHAKKIREAAGALNAAMWEACQDGLRLDIELHVVREMGVSLGAPIVTPIIERVEEL